MKKLITILLFCYTAISMGQSISSSVINSAGEEYHGSSVDLTVSIGEPVIDTYSSSTSILTTGFLQGENATHELDLTLYLEGLYNGPGSLNKAQNESGNRWPGDIADKISVSLARNITPYDVLFTLDSVNLLTDGSAVVNFPVKYSGSNFLVIKHRNSLETWSAAPLTLANSKSSYNFTTSSSSAYGNNEAAYIGGYVIYGGDVNQDGIIDLDDMTGVDNLSSVSALGYIPDDVNGDGLIDSSDMAIIDNNASATIGAVTPAG